MSPLKSVNLLLESEVMTVEGGSVKSSSDENETQIHWREFDELVSRWLKERQSLIVLLCAVHGLRDIMSKDTPVAVKVQAFCQVLMDYVLLFFLSQDLRLSPNLLAPLKI